MRFRALDGWRGLAALLVSLYHLPFFNHLYDSPFLRNSYLFVDFFFVLSGFVITHAYKNRLHSNKDILTFMKKRFIRLWPLHAFILILFLCFEFLKLVLFQLGLFDLESIPFTDEYSIESFFSNLFLVHALGIHHMLTWNYPSWSISAEFYTYLVFAIVFLISKRSKRLIQLQYISLILISFYILYINIENMNLATYDLGIIRCIPSFLLGSISYVLFLGQKNKKVPMVSLLEIGSIIGIYFFFVYSGNNQYSLLAPFIFSLAIYIFSFEQGVVSNILKNSFIQYLGKWSYSIYMLHALIILIIGRAINILERVLNTNFKIDYMFSSNITEHLVLIENQYLMDMFTVLYLSILVYISSKTYKYIELKGNKLFSKPKSQ